MKGSIYIFSDWFWPAYKAGGPVQSLLNLCAAMDDTGRIHVITGASDLGERASLEGITTNTWNRITLPGLDKKINVWYSKGQWRLPVSRNEKDKKIFYLNGIYSFQSFLKPLLFLKWKEQKLVICPRGMLQKGALSVKPLKKRLYLGAMKRSGLLAKAVWHATNKDEEADIRREFGAGAKVIVAPNIPKKPLQTWTEAKKKPGSLRLVYLSLITEKKGLHILLEVLQQTSQGVSLDIYGPVKDHRYWTACRERIEKSGGRVQYKGSILPSMVQDTFLQYDASVLLTKGENFGHALYESLSAGRPVITSHFTPWSSLESKMAGWNLDIRDKQKMADKLAQIAAMDTGAFQAFCQGAHRMASAYYNSLDPVALYKPLFSITE